MSQRPGEPTDGNPLQPPADQRYPVAADVNPVIAVGECAGDVVEPRGGAALLLKSQGMRTPISGHTPRMYRRVKFSEVESGGAGPMLGERTPTPPQPSPA